MCLRSTRENHSLVDQPRQDVQGKESILVRDSLLVGKRMGSKRTVAIKKEREVKMYASLWHTSHCLLKRGKADPKGSFHQFMASLVFAAFSLEAYLNHIGPKVFKCWDDLERLGPKEKLSVIAERLQVDVNYGHRPWQVMKHLFGFRNDIAHGKSEVVKPPDRLEPLDRYSDDQLGELERTEWEEYCTEKNVLRARQDVERIVLALYSAGQFENDYPFTPGFQLGSATLMDE